MPASGANGSQPQRARSGEAEFAQSRRPIAPDLRGHDNSFAIAGSYGLNFDLLVKGLFEQYLLRVKRMTLADAKHHPHQENLRARFSAAETDLDAVRQAANELAGTASGRTRK